MITVRELQLMLDQAIHSGQVKLDSEVRFITSQPVQRFKDCSLETQYAVTQPGKSKSGVPLDRRYGDGVLHLAMSQPLQEAKRQILSDLDFIWVEKTN